MSPLSSRTIGFDVKLQPLSSIIVGIFYESQLGSIWPRIARGTPKAGQREPKGIPKGTTGVKNDAQRELKGSQKSQKEPKSAQGTPKALQRHPKEAKGEDIYQKLPINRPSGRCAIISIYPPAPVYRGHKAVLEISSLL